MLQECHHIMPSGVRCQALALRGMAYCYFHVPGRSPAQGQSRARRNPLKLPSLADRYAVQIAMSQVLNAMASSKISPRTAGQLLYGLQTATDNLIRAGCPPLRNQKTSTPGKPLNAGCPGSRD